VVEFVELEPPPDAAEEDPALVAALPVLARTVVGVVDASVCPDDVRADVLAEDESKLLFPVVFDSELVGEAASADPEVGVSVACEPLFMAAVRPETLWAWVEVPVEPWM